MLTTEQVRAARAALRWTIEDLSSRTDLSTRTIKRIEGVDGLASAHVATLIKIQSALEAAGIEFIGTPEDGPGIRLRRSPKSGS